MREQTIQAKEALSYLEAPNDTCRTGEVGRAGRVVKVTGMKSKSWSDSTPSRRQVKTQLSFKRIKKTRSTGFLPQNPFPFRFVYLIDLFCNIKISSG